MVYVVCDGKQVIHDTEGTPLLWKHKSLKRKGSNMYIYDKPYFNPKIELNLDR
jgi:hypothetical protein